MSPLIDKLQWRYATKRMDASKAVPQDKVQRIMEAAAHGQAQITEGSHWLVFAAWHHYTAERINHMFDLTNEQRGHHAFGLPLARSRLVGKPEKGSPPLERISV